MIDKIWWAGEGAGDSAAHKAFQVVKNYCDSAPSRRPSDIIKSLAQGAFVPSGNPKLRELGRVAVRPDCSLKFFPWSVDPTMFQGFASWLHRSATKDFCVLVDWQALASAARERLDAVLTKLFLHELAHLCFHRDLLFRDLGPAHWSNPTQEEEAWGLGMAIFGLCIADYARECREDGLPDDAWRFA